MVVQEKIAAQLPSWRERVKKLLAEHGDVKVGEVTIKQVYGGMRDVKGLVTDISCVDPNEGIRLRGYTIDELLQKLPKQPGMEIPLVGGLYFLLLVGEIPTLVEAMEIEDEWEVRSQTPQHVFDVLRAMPANTQPMTLFSQAILSMQIDSIFTRKYDEGLKKDDFWIAMLDDSLNLTARLPIIAAFIYSLKHNGGKIPAPNRDLDWGSNFAFMMGIQDAQYAELARLYFIIHSDHESGNVSAHAAHLVGSTLSDIFYATSAGVNGLAGPLHGRANQEALEWLQGLLEMFHGVPGKEELRQVIQETIRAGKIIPGYGHAILRKADPRFEVQMAFGKKYFPEDPIFKLACMVYEIAPDILHTLTCTRDPWPNVDAISGSLQQHYGIQDDDDQGSFGFYTVLFGMSRALGISANAVWARALGQPLERPKSVTTAMLEKLAQSNG